MCKTLFVSSVAGISQSSAEDGKQARVATWPEERTPEADPAQFFDWFQASPAVSLAIP